MSRITCPGLHRVLSFVLIIALLVGLCPAALAVDVAEKVANITAPTNRVLISQANYAITNGMTESQIILNNNSGSSQVLAYMATIEPDASVKLKASYAGYYTKNSTSESRAEAASSLKWDLKTTTAQAAAYEEATGETVVTAVNGDYYNMQTGQALGYLIMEGNVIQTGGKTQDGSIGQEPFFAVLKDGSYDIRDYGSSTDDVAEAISGPFYLIQDSTITVSSTDTWLAPRNSIGIKEDGSVVIMVADGRAGMSDGLTLYELAQMLLSAGCVEALYLDGGGSATYASRHEGSETLDIQNHPSDGPERIVATSLMVVSTSTETGVFDHASLSPANDIYMVGAPVQFTADGVDAGGYPADLPGGLTWAVDESSTALGTISNTGLFTSNGTCGTLKINLLKGSNVVGSTSIELQEPQELYIPADSTSLAFKATTDFDLTARYNNRDMVIGQYVYDWRVESKTEGVDAADIGTFSGNSFTTVKAKETLYAAVTVSYAKQDGTVLTDTIDLEIGRMPTVFWDMEADAEGNVPAGVGVYDQGKSGIGTGFDPGEEITFYASTETGRGDKTESGPFFFDGSYLDENDPSDYSAYPADAIFNAAGYPFFTNHTSYMQPFSAGGAVVSAEDGEVRFGEHALRWDYDYTNLNAGYKNVNMWLIPTEDYIIDGTPSGLGFWVYAPEGTPNYWLWLQIGYYDENGNLQRPYIHLKTQEQRNMQYTGIYWEGWMYVEADLTPYAQYVREGYPLTISHGRYFLSLTFIPGGSANENGDKVPMGDFSKGSLYFDNFRLVYGDTVDDMDAPVIDEIKLNGTVAAEDGTTTLASGTVAVNAAFHDVLNDNTTGINVEKNTIYVDGLRQTLTESTETGAAATVTLPNGTHSVTVSTSDGFGNATSVTRYFTVNDAQSTYGTLSLTGAEAAVVGEPYALELKSVGSDLITATTTRIRITDTFGEPQVTFPEGVTGESNLVRDILTIKTTQTTAAGTLATITFPISPAIAQGTVFTYSVESGTYTDNGAAMSFAQNAVTVGVETGYTISADIMTVGGNGKIYVTKADGSAPGRIALYQVVEGQEDVLIGRTNSAGVLVTNRFCQNVGESFTIYATGTEGRSFYYTGITTGLGSDEVAPTNVRLNAVADPTTTQSVSWFSAPQYTERKAIVEYVEKAEYESGEYEFDSAVGTCKAHSFSDDNQSTQINTVAISGLTPDTTYCYRVGDGVSGHWSEIAEFTTASSSDEDVAFFIQGDTQLTGNPEADAEDIATMHALADKVNDEAVDFGLQTGDFIDDAGSLEGWNEILSIFSEEYGHLPLVQVMGNHEYYGDLSGSHAEAIFDLPDKDYYSVEYGNTYVAVINCNANLEAAAAWLIADAAASDCEWRVLALHQPPYYTNPKGSSAAYNAYLPAAIDEAAIDFVFSGHDHAYARTEPLTGGEVDEENGAVYFICGDLGEKSRDTNYAPENNPDFHFATIRQDYDAVYLIANTSGNDMTVTAYNLDGTVLDTYTMHHTTICEETGHNYVYDRDADTVSCTVCGDAPEAYTGWATDSENGGEMYFIAGNYKTGWFTIGFELYHLDEETGISHKLTVTEDVPTTCGKQGYLTVTCECGETYTMEYEQPTGHHYNATTAEDGTVYYVCSECGNISSMNLPFVDVEDEDWFAEAVNYVYQNQLFNGVNSMSFAPKAPMNRAMLVVVLWRIAGSPGYENVQTVPYEDCLANLWYTAAINWAADAEIVTGFPDGTFRPTLAISRAQMVTVLYRFAKYMGMDVSATTSLENFSDYEDVQEYAIDAMAWAVAEGLITGLPGERLAPNGTATRAQVSTIIMRFQQIGADDAEGTEPVAETPEPDFETDSQPAPAEEDDVTHAPVSEGGEETAQEA